MTTSVVMTTGSMSYAKTISTLKVVQPTQNLRV